MSKAFMSTGVAGVPVNATFMYYAIFCEGAWEAKKKNERVEPRLLLDEGTEKVKRDLVRVITTSLGFWLPANTANFLFAPAQFRPVVLAIQSSFWMGFLSFVQHAGPAVGLRQE